MRPALILLAGCLVALLGCSAAPGNATPTIDPIFQPPTPIPAATTGDGSGSAASGLQPTILGVQGGRLGGAASVQASTQPAGRCVLSFVAPGSDPANAFSVGSQIADSAGRVSWSWTIPDSTPTGDAAIIVTCAGASTTARIQITR